MPPKTQQKSKAQKMAAAQASKGKKKKWSKGKMREKAANQVLFDKETYDRFYKEVPKMKCITISSVTERFKIGGALARRAFRGMYKSIFHRPYIYVSICILVINISINV